MCHKYLIFELVHVATDKLNLNHIKYDTNLNNIGWNPDWGIKYTYKHFEIMCPMLSDMFDMHFSGVPICTTYVEHVFSTTNFVSHANMTNSTLNRCLKITNNVRSQFCRNIESMKADSKNGGPEPPTQLADDNDEYDSDDESPSAQQRRSKYRELRQLKSLCMFFKHAEEHFKEAEAFSSNIPTRAEINKKRKMDEIQNYPHIQRELETNIAKRKDNKIFGPTQLSQRMDVFHHAVSSKSESLVNPIIDKIHPIFLIQYSMLNVME